MKAGKSQSVQFLGTTFTLVLIFGALATVWASIIGLFLWAFLLLSSFGGDQSNLVLSSMKMAPLGLHQLGDLLAIRS